MALELVGGALLSAFLQVAFEKLASPQVLDFFRGRKLDQKLLNNLEIKLNSIQALADDAELKQFRDPPVRNWLLKVKDALFDAEDLLDEIQHEISKCQVEAEAEAESQTCTCKVPNFFKSSPVSSFNKEIKSRMEQVLEDLENLASQSGYLGLQNASGVGSGFGGAVSLHSESTSLVVESVIYGRDDDKEMIFNWLTSDIDNCNKLSILSIVGMGGLGKTTLAQHVFNDPRIENKFDIKAWVCVSDEFDVFNVTRTILEAVTKSTDDSRNRETVQGRLREKLTGNKFFLVLDDVWNRNQKEWKDLQTPLNYGASGSKIVVTTRDKKVASIVGSNKTHCLELLQDDHCWRLFTKHAFRDDSHQPNPDFKEIGTKIVEKCKGLPLALTTIGSLLHQKSSISEWEGILKSEIWEFSEEDSSIVPALALSYHHLPSRIKRCFAYCALFPKDYRFDKEGLIQLWMAENFLQCHQQSRSPEKVGEQYFNDLLSRSFFQQSSTVERTPFVMHDLLNDLAKYVCGDICFRLENDQATNIPKTTRHFSVASDHVTCFDGFRTLYNAERLRTFMSLSEEMSFRNYNRWYCKMSTRELFSKFKFLRVLSLSGYSNLTKVPNSVGNLKYLSSLDLSNTEIVKLPESTCSLYNLQILKLNYCEDLKELPSNLHKLTNLHRLELIDTGVRKVPAHLGKLKYLQVLMSSFNVGKSREFSIQLLGELNLHGSLSIRQLQNVENPSDALAVDLKNKTHLVELELEWDSDWNPDDSTKERDVIENLQPSKHLKKLTMRNYRGKQFPSWLLDNSSCNVVSLSLNNCKGCLCLPPLGRLPSLKELSIEGLDGIVSINADFFGSSSCSFTSLESLEFSDMKEWEEWECKGVTGAFPRLQRLSIVRCPNLKGHLPEQLCHLNYLKISGCEQLVPSALSAPDIHKLDLGDCGKLQIDHPTTLKELTIEGHNVEAALLEQIGRNYSCSNNNIPMHSSYDFLVTLHINGGCDSLTTIPLDIFPILKKLDLRKCRNLQRISQGQAHNHLQDLYVGECPQLESLPEGMHVLLPSLDYLWIKDCPKVEMFPEGGLPSNLKSMALYGGSYKLIYLLKSALGGNHSLETLYIGEVDVERLPEEGVLPHSLKILLLKDCPRLQCLPEEGLPKSISALWIWGDCPLLKQRCREPEGEDWPKIAHFCPLLNQRCREPGGEDWPKIADIENVYII
ncbi:Putative disease resistance RPP13-like protein 1 [Glycine soja]|nr:Putative disease resistance RPP13-like protein 1 [Glycine soja]